MPCRAHFEKKFDFTPRIPDFFVIHLLCMEFTLNPCRTKTILGVIIKQIMSKETINDTIGNGGCSSENRKDKGKRILFHSEYDEPGIYEEFRPHSGPGSSYKPWIYGK